MTYLKPLFEKVPTLRNVRSGRMIRSIRDAKCGRCEARPGLNHRNQTKKRLALELLINLNLVARRQAIGFIRHPDNRHQFFKHRVGHTLLARSGGM